jgi:predicted alpha/beta superfamily hydrolase
MAYSRGAAALLTTEVRSIALPFAGGAITDRRNRMKPTLLRLTVLSSALALITPGLSTAQTEQAVEQVQGTEKITFRSAVLSEERTILVRVPEEYEQTTRKYPVLYVLDGEYFFQQASSAVQFHSELGYEAGQHPVPEMIVVGIPNVDRERDYTPTYAPEQAQGRLSFPTSGGAEVFQNFLEQELFPLVESRYRAHPHRTLSGWSLGGLFTVHAYLEKPDLFSRYLAISPSLWWDDSVVVKATRQRLGNGGALSAKPLVITLGTLEGGDMDGAVRRNFVPLLTKRGPSNLDFTFSEIAAEDHGHVPYKADFGGLTAVWDDWVVPTSVLEDGLTAVEGFFQDLSGRCGYPVDIPLSVYRYLSLTLPDIGPALEVARLAAREFPHSSVAYLALGRLEQMAGDTAAAVGSLRKARELELARPVPQSERLRAITGRLRRLEPR